jgi:hypothetical protein
MNNLLCDWKCFFIDAFLLIFILFLFAIAWLAFGVFIYWLCSEETDNQPAPKKHDCKVGEWDN